MTATVDAQEGNVSDQYATGKERSAATVIWKLKLSVIPAAVVYGTHPIPEKYLKIHNQLETWKDPEWQKIIEPTLVNEKTRLSYD